MKNYLYYLFESDLVSCNDIRQQLTDMGAIVTDLPNDTASTRHLLRKNKWKAKYVLVVGQSTEAAQIAAEQKADFCGICTDADHREQLLQLPHRKLLTDIDLLPLVHRPTKYHNVPFVPRKLQALNRLANIKQMRGQAQQQITEQDNYICRNCGTSYHGLYCPRCGQSHRTQRFTMRNIFNNALADFLSLSSAFSRNFVELFYRPGYMIRDYIDGHRINYHKPFSAIFVLATIYMILAYLIDPDINAQQQEPSLAEISANIEQIKQSSDPEMVPYLEQIQALADSANAVLARSTMQMAMEMQDSLARHNPAIGLFKLNSQDSLALAERIQKSINRTNGQKLSEVLADEPETSGLFGRMMHFSRQNIIIVERFQDKYYHQGTFLYRAVSLVESLFAKNKALSLLLMIPIFTYAARRSFRTTLIGQRLNLAEYFLVFAHFGAQLMWVSIFLLCLTRSSSFNIVTDLPIGMLFLSWDFRQLFNLSWPESLLRTLVFMSLRIVWILTIVSFTATIITTLGMYALTLIT